MDVTTGAQPVARRGARIRTHPLVIPFLVAGFLLSTPLGCKGDSGSAKGGSAQRAGEMSTPLDGHNREMVVLCSAIKDAVRFNKDRCERMGLALERAMQGKKSIMQDYTLHTVKKKGSDKYEEASKRCRQYFKPIRKILFRCVSKDPKVGQAVRDLPALH
jgi:hypothetical protein